MTLNSICKLKYIFNDEVKEKKDVISVSLFRMVNGYKSFDKYMKGLELITGKMINKLSNFDILLFIDQSIIKEKEIYNKIIELREKNKQLKLIEYECPKFIKENKHEELFGTFIRFLPFFDIEGNNTKCVISIDADICQRDMEYIIEDYQYLKKIKSEYHYITNMFYELLSKWGLSENYSILAGRQICKKKFPLKLLTEYLECVKNKSCERMEYIKEKMDYKKYSTFPYGIDEYFLNNILLEYIKKNEIPYSVTVRYSLTAPMYYYIKNTPELNDNKEKKESLTKVLKNILNDESKDDYIKLFDKFDRIFYKHIYENNKDINNNKREIVKRYYNYINKMWKEKNYELLPESVLKKTMNYKNNKYISKTNIYLYVGNEVKKRYVIDKLQ